MSRKVLIIPEEHARSIALCYATVVDFCRESDYEIEFSIFCHQNQLLAINFLPFKKFITYVTDLTQLQFDVTINLKEVKSETNPAIKYLSMQAHSTLNIIPRQPLYEKIFNEKLLSLKNRPRIHQDLADSTESTSGQEATFFILAAMFDNEANFWKYNLDLHSKLIHFSKINIISDNTDLMEKKIVGEISPEYAKKIQVISIYKSDLVSNAITKSFLYIGHSSSLDYVLTNQATKTMIIHQTNRDMAWSSFGAHTLHLIKNKIDSLEPSLINSFYDYLIEDKDFNWFHSEVAKNNMTLQEQDWWLRPNHVGPQNLLNNMVHTYYCFFLFNLDFQFEAIEINKNTQKNLEQCAMVISHLNNLSLHFVERIKLYIEKKIDFKTLQKYFRETQDLSLKLLKNYPDLLALFFFHISNHFNSPQTTISSNELVQETQAWYDLSLAFNAINDLIESLLNHPINKSIQVSDT
jgi:hypothetical protein